MTTQPPFHPELRPRIEARGLVGRQGKPYHADPGLVAAANVALTLERPLLLTGETGCGKTDFAWAAAHDLGGAEPLQCYVRSDTRARDLLYSYDAISRFGDAHHGGTEGAERARDPRDYIVLQDLGEAFISRERRVVLIDEIDKAPRDLPNDLLRELEQNKFEIPEIPGAIAVGDPSEPKARLRRVMERPRDAKGKLVPAPLVIITSNIERQLPDAFLRRCIFWHIASPTEDRLRQILTDHDPGQEGGDFFRDAVQIFTRVREIPGLSRKPGTAELLDWVGALTRVFDPAPTRLQIRAFAADLGQTKRKLGWHSLPALGCLVKMREDQDCLV
jgi:MoxR-like ATPase